jgi:hypothetical protein
LRAKVLRQVKNLAGESIDTGSTKTESLLRERRPEGVFDKHQTNEEAL